MALTWTDLLNEINDLFINITRDKIFKKDTGNFKSHVMSCLKLNSQADWDYILASEDILEDSNLAIEHFMKFGLSGLTKLEFLGEKYIRLYGLLNATYLQQQAILNIGKYFQCPNLSDVENSINALKIRELRNKIGSHSVNYADRETNATQAFVPVRMMMKDYEVDYFEHTQNTYHKVDLRNEVEIHLKLMCESYLNIVKKSVITIYKSNPEKISSISEKYEPFEKMLNGAILMKNKNDNSFVVFQPVGPHDVNE